MKQSWSDLIVLLGEPSPTLDQAHQASCALQSQLVEDPQQSTVRLFKLLCREEKPASRQQEMVWEYLLQVLAQHLSQPQVWQSVYLDSVLQLYQLLGNESNIRHLLLQICSTVGDAACLAAIANLLCTDPPLSATNVGLVLAPLFQDRELPYATLFPRLLDALEHPTVAGATLDLANHLSRKRRFVKHPASARLNSLQSLLRNLNHRMEQLAEHPQKAGKHAQQISQTISDTIALVIALCDTLALIEDNSSIAALRQTLELPHRRLQTEAAAALARLGDAIGVETLVALAAQPVVRLHALAYAEELNLTDQIDPAYLTEIAKAESMLALWLAQEQQMGIPPTALECIDQRTQLWPGYEIPVDCFLFRYHFQFSDSSYSNVGIVGPVTRSISANLGELPAEDIYAIFAGWHAEHEDIQEQAVGQLSDLQMVEVLRFQRGLYDRGYDSIESLTWGSFLGDHILVAKARQDAVAGIVITDSQDVYWHPSSEDPRPLTTEDVYNLYKGRKLLNVFNQ